VHYSRHGFPTYIYDLIGPERAKIDEPFFHCAEPEILRGGFMLRKDGVGMLSPQLEKVIVRLCN
jgi:CRISPR-associated protein Cas1